MRIVLDIQACQTKDRNGETGRYSLALARAIARQANEHEIIIALNARFPATIEPLRLTFDGLLPRDRVVVFTVPQGLAEIDPTSIWRRRAAEQVRMSFLAGLRPDVVHMSSLFVGLEDDAVASAGGEHELFGSAATLSEADLLRQASSADAPMRDWRLNRLREVQRLELLLATSDHARKQALETLELPEERVVTVLAAADDEFGLHKLTPDELVALQSRLGISRPFLLLQVGTDDFQMAEMLLHAFARLPETIRSRYQLAVVGDRAECERDKLTATLARCGLPGDEAIIASGVPGDDLRALYGASTLVVSASESDCLGSSALTAMSCGAPVIAAAIGGLPEVIGREDALFDPRDDLAIATKIHQALSDPGFRDSLQDHGSQQASRFSWDASAARTLEVFAQLHERNQANKTTAPAARRPRLRLAFVSPLPPERSGIADYSTDLLPELARHYDIDVILHQASMHDPWVAANATPRSVSWFDAHAADYGRIVYQFGNSHYHEHMFALLARHPGVVVLHDFFLSGPVHHCDQAGYPPGAFAKALYRSHGYAAIADEMHTGREAALWKYPCNKVVLDGAEGVIVHSRYAMQLADAWYGAGCAREWQYIPLMRVQPPVMDRSAARQRLGLANTDFLVCSLGHLGPSKLDDLLLDAWLDSPLSADPSCFLAYVGETHPGEYHEKLIRTMKGSSLGDRVSITGFAPRPLYEDYLAAADIAVQLRTLSRGETSASVLDCLAHGVPTIANANGSAAELPEDTLLMIQDEFSQAELVDALVQLQRDPHKRDQLSRCGSEYVRTVHSPAHAGRLYRKAIERFAVDSDHAHYRRLVRSVRDMVTATAPTRRDLIDVAASVSANRPAKPPRQMLVDVTVLVRQDLKTGIERVSRAVLKALIDRPPEGYRVEPVYDAGGHYAYARHFTLGLLGAAVPELHDAPIETGSGDVFLGLDLCQQWIPHNQRWFNDFRNRGASVFFLLYDLLPVLRPEVFPNSVQPTYTRWLHAVTQASDGIICISRAVADEVIGWLESGRLERTAPLRIGYFHLGADLAASLPSRGLELNAESTLQQVRARPSFLMVGTIEPRKGHAQALSAFERLWAAGVDVSLIIVGKEGWNLEQLTLRLRTHPERSKRLLWLEGVSDEMLLRLYESATALLAASEGEGFGLPLVEAAQHRLPIIARDLPVFREVAGEHAFYFIGNTADDLAAAISAWLSLRESGEAPSSEQMPWLTWAQSTAQLMDVIQNGRWYAHWSSQ